MPKPEPIDPVLHALKAALAERRERDELPVPKSLPERTELTPDAPAPRIGEMLQAYGPKGLESSLKAWDMRLRGKPITDIAHEFCLSIEAARILIKEAHEALREDLKENVDQNRALDLARIDGLLATFYPAAQAGDDKAAAITLKCIERRAKLTGTEPDVPNPRTEPTNVLVWVQQQLPAINRIVDALPVELAPGAPS